jgi:DNA-binding transcriptional regulator YiaG
MPNFAGVLKEEIARLARKEVKSQADPMAEKLVELRRTVGALRKQVAEMAKALAEIKGKVKSDEIISADNVAEGDVEKSRITGGRIANLRARLGLSRNQMATLLGVNANSIYLWEQGKTRPRAAAKAKLMQLRSLGRRAVGKLLKAAKGEGDEKAKPAAPKKAKKAKKAKRARKAKAAVAAPAESAAPAQG